MSVTGSIILIEDDANDLDVIESALKAIDINNEIKAFTNAQHALEYLTVTQDLPFIILCDIRLPGMNGLEFRKAISQNEFLRKKSIPFLFYTGVVSEQIVNVAYDLTVQGFFQKPTNFEDLKKQLTLIMGYWTRCLHPNNYLA